MSDDLNGRPTEEERAKAALSMPRADEPPVEMNPNLPGIPMEFPEGAGAQETRRQEEAAQVSHKQVWKDTLNQSIANSAAEWVTALPSAMNELISTGTAELEPYREELTKDVPLYLHDDIMSSMTLVGARARRQRLIEDQKVQARLAAQSGLSRTAISLAAGILDADLPLIFATGGTIAAGKTAMKTAQVVKGITGSTKIARGAGDLAVGVSGGGLSGAIIGGVGMATRDDYDSNSLFVNIMAGAVTGGAVSPVVGRLAPDQEVWSQAAQMEVDAALRKAEADINKQVLDPEAPINNNTPFVQEIDEGSLSLDYLPQDRSIGAADGGTAPEEITSDALGVTDAGAPEGIAEHSLRMQQWRQDTSFAERYAEDTQNATVKLLTGGYNDGLKGALGQLLTMAQRDFTKLIHSQSPSANFVAAEILESASGLGRNGSTASVLREMFYSSALVHSAKPLRDFRGAYFRSRGLSPVRLENQRQFSADLRLQMQKRYLGGEVDPEFKEVIDRIDRTHEELLGHMRGIEEARSVRGAREIETRPGYFRYDWAPQRFKAFLQVEGGQAALTKAFKQGYMRATGMDSQTAEEVAKAIVRRFRDKGVGVGTADSRLLDLDSRTGIEEVLTEAGVRKDKIERIMKRLDVNTQERSKKGYLRHRLEVDLSTPIPGTDKRLVDLMSDDFERSMHQYAGDAAGAAALAHKGLRDKADIARHIDTILYEQQKLGENNWTRPELEAIFSQFQGSAHRGYMWGTEGQVSPLTSLLTKATRASLLQRTGLTQLMDSANLFVANGVATTMEPLMKRLGWAGDDALSKAARKELRDELESIGVVVGQDHDLFAPHLTIDETDLSEQLLINAGQRGMQTVERATYFASGQIHATAMQQRVAAAATATNVLRTIAGHKTNLTERKLRDIGLEGEILHDIRDMIETGVIEIDGGKIRINSNQWDPKVKLEFGAAIARATHQQAQKSLIGETSVWMNTDMGKLFSALKTFSLVATQKQMARNLMIGGAPHILGASAWQMGFSYAVLTLAQAVQGTEMSPIDRARLAVAYTPNLGTIPMVTDPITSMLGFDDLNFSPYGRYASYVDTPVFEQVQKITKAPGAIADMLSGDGNYQDMQNARAMFFLNWYGMKRLWESM